MDIYDYNIECDVDQFYVEVGMDHRFVDKSNVTVTVDGDAVSWSGYVSAEVDLTGVPCNINFADWVDYDMVNTLISDGHIDPSLLNVLTNLTDSTDTEIMEELVERMITNETTYLLAKAVDLYAERKTDIAVGQYVNNRA